MELCYRKQNRALLNGTQDRVLLNGTQDRALVNEAQDRALLSLSLTTFNEIIDPQLVNLSALLTNERASFLLQTNEMCLLYFCIVESGVYVLVQLARKLVKELTTWTQNRYTCIQSHCERFVNYVPLLLECAT